MSLSGVVVLIGSGDCMHYPCKPSSCHDVCVVVGRVIGFARVQLLVARNRTSHGNVWHSNDDDEKQG